MKPRAKTILVVEDSIDNRLLIASALKDFHLIETANLSEAKRHLDSAPIDLILLDINLPDGDGLTFFSLFEANEQYKKIPVLIVSAHSTLPNKAAAFSLGAEDFVSKPFDPAELRIRVVARLKKSESSLQSAETLVCHNLQISLSSQRAYIKQDGERSEAVELTSKEFKILAFLMKNFESICSREKLLDSVWGHGVNVIDRTVDTHVSHIRRKIHNANVTIESTPNLGYRLMLKSEPVKDLSL